MVSNRVHKLLCLLILIAAAAPAAADTTFLVFPPENLTKVPTLGWIGEGIAVAISEECQMPGVETIGWEERVRYVESADLPPHATLSRASMIRVAQRAGVERLVFGSYTGTEKNLRISLWVLEVKSLRLSGEIVANGPAQALPELENELAWVILSNSGSTGALSRADFSSRKRVVPNQPYSLFINCLSTSDASDRFNTLQRALELYRDFPQASYLLGAYYFQGGDCSKAIQYLKPALKEAQYLPETDFMLGTCYLRQNNPADAIQAYSGALARSRSLEVLNNLGVACLRKGDYPLAVQNLMEARSLAKTDMTVGINLAILRRLQGDDTAALGVLDELVNEHPDHGMLQYLYSLTLSSCGQAEKAAAALENAAKLGIDVEKMQGQDPRSWTRLFNSWTRRPASALMSEARPERSPQGRQRH